MILSVIGFANSTVMLVYHWLACRYQNSEKDLLIVTITAGLVTQEYERKILGENIKLSSSVSLWYGHE